MLRVCACDDTACIILLNMLILRTWMMRLLEFACPQVPLFIQESKSYPRMVFIIGAAGKSPSTLSIFRARRSLSWPRTPFPHIFWHLCIHFFYLCLIPWEGSVWLSYKMMGWCWGLFRYIHREITCFVLVFTDLLYTTGLMLRSFPYLLDEKKTTHYHLSDTTERFKVSNEYMSWWYSCVNVTVWENLVIRLVVE